MEYDIIREYRMDYMTNLVNIRLNKGWELVGGISITSVIASGTTNKIVYAQAMCKKIKD